MEDKCRCSFLCFHSFTSPFKPNRHILTTRDKFCFKLQLRVSNQRWRFYTNTVNFLNHVHKKPIGGCRPRMDVCVNQNLTPAGAGSGGGNKRLPMLTNSSLQRSGCAATAPVPGDAALKSVLSEPSPCQVDGVRLP